jgi:endonuclease/exonuclease/phosphatase family metal-dependent hydrolase
MRRTLSALTLLSSLLVWSLSCPSAHAAVTNLTVLSFNIWVNGGSSLTKCVEAIRTSGADIVGLQECNATTARSIATNLGFYYLGVSDVSIVSRYPIVQTIATGGGSAVIVELAPGQPVYFFNCHLPAYPYGPYSMREGRDQTFVIQQENTTRMPPLQTLLRTMAPYLAGTSPCFLVGDFNAPSHLDYSNYPWPTTVACEQAGLLDSYRLLHPNNRLYPPAFTYLDPGITWTPRTDQEPNNAFDRIDFVFFSKDETVTVSESSELDGRNSASPWPSDHRAVLSRFRLKPPVLSEAATQPTPPADSTNVSVQTLLSWVAGTNAQSHRVYFGTALPLPLRTNQTNNAFSPGPLTPDKRYYWRVDEVTPSGVVTGQVWSFQTAGLTRYEWNFVSSSLAPTLGRGVMSYADGATTSNLTSFGLSDGVTIPHLQGQPVRYLRVPAFAANGNGLQLTFSDSGPNGGGVYLNQFTIIYDLLVPAPLGWTALFNTNPQNGNEADFYIDPTGRLGTSAIGFSPAGTVSAGAWVRIGFAADLATGTAKYYLNGSLVFTGAAGLDGRHSLYSNVDAGPDLLLFNDPAHLTHLLYLSSVAFTDRELSATEMQVLGQPNDLGIFVQNLPPVSIRRQNSSVQLTWPGYGTMRLQRSTSGLPQTWQDIPETTGSNAFGELMQSMQFYRLSR